MLDLGKAGRLGGGHFCLELLDTACVCLLSLLPAGGHADVEIGGQRVEEGAEHVQTVGEELTACVGGVAAWGIIL